MVAGEYEVWTEVWAHVSVRLPLDHVDIWVSCIHRARIDFV